MIQSSGMKNFSLNRGIAKMANINAGTGESTQIRNSSMDSNLIWSSLITT